MTSSTTNRAPRRPPGRFLDSPLHQVFRRVNAFADEHPEAAVTHLHVGDAGFPPPDGVGAALAATYEQGIAGYCDGVGLVELRDVLADKVITETGRWCTAERIVVSPGSTHALYALFSLVAEPGDTILLPAVHWPVYLQQIAALGLRPRFYGTNAAGEVDRDAIEDALAAGCRLVLLNSPANPTGYILQSDAIAWVIEAAAAHEAVIVSDEAYEDFAFAAPHTSVAAVRSHSRTDGRDAPPIFTTYTFSKTFALTGLRVGYVVCPDPGWAAALGRVQEASLVCPSTPAQHGALHAMSYRDTAIARARAHLLAARRLALPRLTELGLVTYQPAGGWYVMCDVPAPYDNAEVFADHLLQTHGVGVAPARLFSPPGHGNGNGSRATPTEQQFRLALCGDLTELERGVDRLAHALQEAS